MYQALYRKYRPQTFDEVVGQPSVTQTLKAQVVSGKLSHAYLFTGSRGTGKTSCAKILAKAVNCLSPVDGSPCNRCAACRSIDSGSCMDVLEIDAASNNGVENVRDLRDDAIYSPTEVKKRVYIIDEVHMLSISAFNALLKIIEEPPAHLMFILATTELHKVPATILSRCQRFSFRRLLPKDISERINAVAYQEGIDLTQEAADLLARLADGSLRDGMSLLDQCAAASCETLDPERVYRCLGLAGSRKAAELLNCVADRDTGAALALFSAQYAAGKDISAMLDELILLCRDLLILKTAPKTGHAMLSGICTDAEIKALYKRFTAAELLRLTALLQQTASGFRQSANPRIDAELCIFQMCEPTLSADVDAINARLSRVEQAIAGGRIVSEALPEPETPPAPVQAESPPECRNDEPAPIQDPPLSELPIGFWPELVTRVVPQLEPKPAAMFSSKENGVLRPVLEQDRLILYAESSFVKNLVDNAQVRAAVAAAAEQLLKRKVGVQIRVVSSQQEQGIAFPQLLSFAQEHQSIFDIRSGL